MPQQNRHKQTQHSLTLQILNGNELESGRTAKCTFTSQGGDVGHAEGCFWSLQDRSQSVPERAFAICFLDGGFCLKSDIAGLEINQARISANAGLVQLRQGDEIRLANLLLKAFTGNIAQYEEQMATPETIVSNSEQLTALLTTEGQPKYADTTVYRETATTVASNFTRDPLAALQTESLISAGNSPVASGQESLSLTPPMADPVGKGGLDYHFLDLPDVENTIQDTQRGAGDDVSRQHIAVSPLMRGLECALPLRNSQDASDFLEEAGRTLQAAIKGLLDLQQHRNSLSDKHLRPLEDNPLRLNIDYSTALDLMFAEGKSPVHLSAPAAIGESLRNIRHHEEANRTAIVESLRVLLDAFSPQSLMRRFVQYRRSHELRQPLENADAWLMYSHYYDELASDRQQGFEMLFNEVYAQVYDRVLREKQRELEA